MPTYRQNSESLAVAQKPLQFAKPLTGGAINLIGPLQIGFTLDSSMSMRPLLDAAASGYNAFVEEQFAIGPAEFTFNCFASKVYPIHSAIPIDQVPPIDAGFLASKSGATALLDGIGLVMQELGRRYDELREARSRVLIAILTDGMENSSKQFSPRDIFQMVHYRRSLHRWEFLFIAASSQGEQEGLKLGIQKSNICRFETNAQGLRLLMRRLSHSVGAYRLGDRNFATYLTDRTI